MSSSRFSLLVPQTSHRPTVWLVVGLSLLAGVVRAVGTDLPAHVVSVPAGMVLQSPLNSPSIDPIQPASLVDFPAAVVDATST
jgi:hypothetical protein